MSAVPEHEKHLLAQWGAEAAKAWWCELSDTDRAAFEKMEPRQLFTMGWQAACVKLERDGDMRRLRYVEANRWCVWFNDRANRFIVQSRNQVVGNIGHGRTVREAIDAAINA